MQKTTTTNNSTISTNPLVTADATTRTFRRLRVSRWAAAAAIALAATPAAFAQPTFFLSELPTPAGYETSSPSQINDQGIVVGDSIRGSDRVATLWRGGKAQVLGKLDKGTYSTAMAVNSTGVVVGDGDDGDGRPLGFITSAGKLVNFYSNNGGNTRPIAISDTGLVGGYFIKGFDTQWRGGIWKIDPKDARKSVLTTLPVLPGGDPVSAWATSVVFNKNMEAAGYSSNSVISQHAVFWKNDAAHTIVDLGLFGNDWTSLAYGLNDLGQVVGESRPPFGSRPVLWQNDAAHTAVELPLLPADNYGSAHLINNAGTIVGYSAYDEPGTWNVSGSKIAVWIGGAPYDLNSLVVQAADGWVITYVASINNLGQMTAIATHNGVTRPVVLNPL
jgi:uncharacterized membrane protein